MTINKNSFSKGFWKKPYLELVCGTSIYLDEEILHIIVRHKWRNKRFVQVVPVERHISINDVGCIEHYHSIANEAVMITPFQYELDNDAIGRVQNNILILLTADDEEGGTNDAGMIPSPGKRHITIMPERRLVTKADGVDLLSMTQDPSCPLNIPSAFVTRVLGRKEVQTQREIFPRNAGGFEDLEPRSKKEITAFSFELLKEIATMLSSEDDAPKLLAEMLKFPPIKKFVPKAFNDKTAYDEFCENKVVLKVKASIAKFCRSDQDTRERLVSLLSTCYPDDWIKKWVGVGRKTVRQAINRDLAFGAGLSIPDSCYVGIDRDRRSGPKLQFLKEWLAVNTEAAPFIRRDGNGVLMKGSATYRKQNRNRSHQAYVNDAAIDGSPVFARSTFYKIQEELGIKDTKSEGGLCPSCNRFGDETWDMIEEVIMYLYAPLDPERRKLLDQLKHLQIYFQRGGEFFSSLKGTSTCIDWCIAYQLSDPFDDDFVSLCECHEHKTRDAKVLERDVMVPTIRSAIYRKIADADVAVNNTLCEGAALFLHDGFLSVAIKNDEIIKIPWDEGNFDDKTLNLLALVDFFEDCTDRHTRYICHLLLDRNQTRGEIDLKRLHNAIAFLDYMMKLRGKKFKSDSSTFHIEMSKGTSAHVMSIKQRIEKQEIVVTLDNAQVGDHQMTWIDSFCSNTGQGGYETSCVIEADLKKAKELYPDLKEICHCSDAGSGYKSTQCVLFARNSKKLTGIQIKHWHYNASGEGKRWETDGHNTDIKSQREAAMRAGQPGKCVTPTNEVDAQMFKGGTVGSFPVLLNFDYKQYMKLKAPLDGIQSYHDFKYLDNGGLRVWKTYQVGPGKEFMKNALDALYTDYDKRFKSDKDFALPVDVFLQETTGAHFPYGRQISTHTPKVDYSSTRQHANQIEYSEKEEIKRIRKEEKVIEMQESYKTATGHAIVTSTKIEKRDAQNSGLLKKCPLEKFVPPRTVESDCIPSILMGSG